MILYDRNNNTILDVKPDDNSYRIKEIMGDNKLFAYFALPTPLNLPLFSWCTFKGEKYFLMKSENFKKIHTESHEFVLELDTYQEYLKTQKFEFFTSSRYGEQVGINSDREIEFSLTLSPRDYVQLLVDNMNLKDSDGGWSVGDCIESDPVLIDFNDQYCWDVLNMLKDSFQTEWEVEGKVIHLRKVEKLKSNPLPLQYGLDKGILSGLERTNYEERIGVVRVKTSDRNIDSSTYGSRTLKMPKDHSIIYHDTEYCTDSTGSVITRRYPLLNTPVIPEATLDLTRIYPKRTGTVSSVIAVDDEKGLYDFVDKDNPVNYVEHIIAGQEMIIVFQTGRVAGIEMKADYVHEEKRFELVPITQNGIVYPQSPYIPSVGDTYAVFYVSLPHPYIDEAETAILSEAVKYLFENENPRYTYNATLDELFSKRRWLEIGGYFNTGYYIRLSEPQYLSAPVDIRIVRVKDYINKPYSPEVTLSDNVQGVSISSELKQVQNINQTITRTGNQVSRITDMRYRDTLELFSMLETMLHLGFTEGISPVAIHSMMAFFGSDQLQYRWVNQTEDPVTEIDHYYFMDDENKAFSAAAGIIQHMTIGIDTMRPAHGAGDYNFWHISAFPPTFVGDKGFLWLYLKCSKTENTGVFLLSETEIALESVPGYYHFLVGSLNSEYNGTRNFTPWNGFSVITPGMLRIAKIASTDGSQFWDMLNKRFFLGNASSYLQFNVDRADTFILKGIMVQSSSGVVQPIDVFRGAYSSSIVYYKGDLVTYNGSTYRYKYDTPYSGRVPTDTTCWEIYVRKGTDGNNGSKGSDGQGYMYTYYPSNSLTPPLRLATPGVVPSGWWTYPEFNGYNYIYISQCISTNGSWGTWSTPALYGMKPANGKDGRIFSFRGFYDPAVTYKGDSQVAEVVEYNNVYYYTKSSFGERAGTVPTNTAYWESYGGNFESLATGLFFAKKALIAGFNFYNDRIESVQMINGVPKIRLDANTGEIIVQSEGGNGHYMNILDGVISWHNADGSTIMSFATSPGETRGEAYIVIRDWPVITKSSWAYMPRGTLYHDDEGHVMVKLTEGIHIIIDLQILKRELIN